MRLLFVAVRLVPYIALSAALSYFLVKIPQVGEYLLYYGERDFDWQLGLRYLLIAIAYFLLWFLIGKSVQEIVAGDGTLIKSRPWHIIFFSTFLILASIPVIVLLAGVVKQKTSTQPQILYVFLVVALLELGLIWVAAKSSSLVMHWRHQTPVPYFNTFTIVICATLICIFIALNAYDVVLGAQTFGAIGIIAGSLAIVQALILLSGYYRKKGLPVFSILLALLILAQIISYNSGPRTQNFQSSSNTPPSTEDAFKDWLAERRSQILAFPKTHAGARYPIYIVAVQGGGYYAAYHAALFLSRLQDRCPNFTDHTFAISSVSGGSLGAAVFAEAVRLHTKDFVRGEGEPECLTHGSGTGPVEKTAKSFFDFDFLSPLVTSALLFDIPNALFPVLQIGPDRGTALQKSFEAAWRQASNDGNNKNAFSENFYGRWSAGRPGPALFLNTTNVTLGIPHLISELDLRSYTDYAKISALIDYLEKEGQSDQELKILKELRKHRGLRQLSFVNTLQFNKRVSPSLSFAVTSSARFPYVTPSSLIGTDESAARDGFSELRYMQLLDGGMTDNSGIFTANAIREVVQEVLDSDQELSNAGSVELISFSHAPVALYQPEDKGDVPEFIAPLSAFDRIRMSRRMSYEKLRENFARHYEVLLFDGAFTAPLSWTLSSATKRDIEKRSGGLEDETPEQDKVCCVLLPGASASLTLKAFIKGTGVLPLAQNEAERWQALTEANAKVVNRPYVPNADVFAFILRELGLGR